MEGVVRFNVVLNTSAVISCRVYSSRVYSTSLLSSPVLLSFFLGLFFRFCVDAVNYLEMQSTLKVESVQRCFCFWVFGSGFLVTVFAFKVVKSKHKNCEQKPRRNCQRTR